jgi:2,5-diamino-6-(ribosylamino)-4(3H)-pyrimidinone 5'-phosphate reductase
VDAVLVGGRTLLDEDPRLTVKSSELRHQRKAAGRTENPVKVGVVSKAAIDLESRFLNDGETQVILFTTLQTPKAQIERLKAKGVQVYAEDAPRVDLTQAMRHLKEAGVQRVLLEGGGTLNAAMFALGLIDEIRLYIAPLVFGGASAPTLADGIGLPREQAVQLELKKTESFPDGGILLTYHVKPTNSID